MRQLRPLRPFGWHKYCPACGWHKFGMKFYPKFQHGDAFLPERILKTCKRCGMSVTELPINATPHQVAARMSEASA